METPNTTHIEDLLLRYCERLLTESERIQVEEWINASEENKRIAKQVFSLYLATDMKRIDTDKALSKIRSRMKEHKPQIRWWKWLQQAAAILFIPLLITTIVLQMNSEKQTAPQMMTAQTNPGTTTSFTLPDGTLVYLNSSSSLTYPTQFSGDTRTVHLQGEGYFEVAKDAKKRFIVSTPHQSQIEVFGTHFNVEAYADENNVTATLIEGKIGFTYQDKSKIRRQIMTPGQKLVYDASKEHVTCYQTSGEVETSWTEGKVIFNNTPLKEALHMLEKRFNVEFALTNPALGRNSFTGTFTTQHLDRILEYFSVSSQIKWRHTGQNEISNAKMKIEIY